MEKITTGWYKGVKSKEFNDLLYFYVMARDSFREERGRDKKYDEYNEREVCRAYRNMEDFIEQELDKAREEGWRNGERYHFLLERQEEVSLNEEEVEELNLLSRDLSKLKDKK